MALEQIKLIKEIEAEAEAIRRKSTAEAKQQIAEGEKRAAEILAQAEAEAHRAYTEAVKRAEEEAETAYSVMIHKTEKECAKLTGEAQLRLADAVSIIVERVVK